MTGSPTQMGAAQSRTGLTSVIVVDDSAVVRGLVSRWIDADERFQVLATCSDGEQGVKKAQELQPDLVILDVEMPRMDGLTALPLILKASPRSKVVMASSLTRKGGEITIKALSLGAADYAPKPEAGRVAGADAYRKELLDKLAALSPRRAAPVMARAANIPVSTRPVVRSKPSLVAIGSSTGGPQALREVIGSLQGIRDVPVVITQHMPKLFTAILAEHLTKAGMPCKEATDGEILKGGHAYIAPGDWHMTIHGSPGAFKAKLDQGPQVNFCRPAVDPMFKTAADAAGKSLLAIVLTGMGADGREGARVIRNVGGQVIVQDQATSVVWGMPGAVAEAGLADMILPLKDIGVELSRRLKGGV
ncbi:protein-glutamate methylesterase/protein-glutamine glutaminase [Woodsholea maritima]|uniref:protein-glutamate methylesterase/protein-glutamine glutaminase n=1 Tax=Woodsholea maritima TaxID=240237 RepID=UPI0003648278|nr:chemotaxis response regulator protein-glutamate methylesterase [Woodsholea maritima]